MPAINAVAARAATSHLAKRNWAKSEAGVIVVFCIVFLVAVGIIGVQVQKCMKRRKEQAAIAAAKA